MVTEVPLAQDQSVRDLLILLQISTDFTLIIKSSICVFILVLRMCFSLTSEGIPDGRVSVNSLRSIQDIVPFIKLHRIL